MKISANSQYNQWDLEFLDLATRRGFPFITSSLDLTHEIIQTIDVFRKSYTVIDTRQLDGKILVFGDNWLFIALFHLNNKCYGRLAFNEHCKKPIFDSIAHFRNEQKTEGQCNVTIWKCVKGEEISSSNIHIDKSQRREVITELYPNYNIKEMIQSFFDSEDSLLILYGPPGTGKTSIIKYILSNTDIENVNYANHTDVIKSSDFWTSLYEYDNDSILVLDDISCDLIRKQGTDTNSFVQNLLGYCDGVIKEDSKVIMTTNQSPEHIDPALIRPGRCFGLIEIRPLTKQEAKEIWIKTLKMNEENFNKVPQKEIITQAELMRVYKDIQHENKIKHIKKTNSTVSFS